ncbi:hypothetical protein SAY86_028277 [Trapa natans]|uniref:Uncharacterized protein n=1 Tax=Trapa natans TaxID=22666 RepID=A0AAN7MHL0_TRANT|nr:hypothetical protein SAY86_028277 [Trapa natans]
MEVKIGALPGMKALFVLSLILAIGFSCVAAIIEQPADGADEGLSTYIIHVQKPTDELASLTADDFEQWYQSYLPLSLDSSKQPHSRIVYSYKNAMTGFAVRLTPSEAKALESKNGVLYAKKEKIIPLHTTHTPGFLRLNQYKGLAADGNQGEGVIIAVLDSGITLDHPSFSAVGMPPPPAKWKGKCEFNNRTVCNNKIIGARNFIQPFNGAPKQPPFDKEGHGTHTASTVAGRPVKGANAFGMAPGTAVGMAPLAHLAIYKVCSDRGCPESAIMAGLDAAIADGVDIISMSLGGFDNSFYESAVATGSFAAIQKGIFVSCSAGNQGPSRGTLSNEAPWVLTVGASNVDRSIRATVRLGNGAEYDGESLNQFFHIQPRPLAYAGAGRDSYSAFCGPGSLSNVNVKGKVVLCDRGGNVRMVDMGIEVKKAGGAAIIIANDGLNADSIEAKAHALPTSYISYYAGLKIKNYIKSTPNPTATILFKGTIIGNTTAPTVASFSSRGPNILSPGILKPDITGPGVSILAAWNAPLDNGARSKVNFNMISGTSMSCPHLSGIAALLRSSHPDWSPAAIKSAIMATADILNNENKAITNEYQRRADYFAMGAGHVNPGRANRPGFIYDTKPTDYIPYLCGLGYKDKQVSIITKTNVRCSTVRRIAEAQLNYPSFSVIFGISPQRYTRTVTNVDRSGASYLSKVYAPAGVDVTVSPSVIKFSRNNQTATYTVTFTKKAGSSSVGQYSEGAILWFSGQHFARSPISVTFN